MSPPSPQLIVCSHRIVTPEGLKDGAIVIKNGIIADVVHADNIPSGYLIEDVGDLVVMPGLVDTHVHINEPGRTEWEGFETATKAAAAGGITTLVDMPLNSLPVTTTVEALNQKLKAVERKLWVDCGFYGGVIPGNIDHLQPLIEAGVLGFKAFLIHSGIDEFPNVMEKDLRFAMPVIAKSGVPLLVHCELTIDPQFTIRNPKSYREYLSSRPYQWEHDAIKLMISLCREYTCKVHIVHLSSSDAMPMLREARENGLPLTVETCPHYLCFTVEKISDGDTRFKCAPPIREQENCEQLWNGLRDGMIDFVVSDHSPSPPHLKCLESGDFQKAWGGISSLQFGLSIVWTEAQKRGFSIVDVANWMSRRPAEFLGLKCKGRIATGCDADLVVWDPNATFTVEPSMIFHRHKLTPYEGRTLYGKVVKTFLRGQKIFDEGKVLSEPYGQIIQRK